MKRILINIAIAAVTLGLCCTLQAEQSTKNMNVIFIAVDDLNDWVGAFGGHEQAVTPNMDKFFGETSLIFDNAYCSATVCGPSRSSLLSGLHPSSSGVYGNGNNMRIASTTKDLLTIPQYFSKHGYHSLSTGKIFHGHKGDAGQWAFDEWHRSRTKGIKKTTLYKPNPNNGAEKQKAGMHIEFGYEEPLEGTKDYQSAKWAAEQLDRDFEGKPFFLALGISNPHLFWYAPKQFFDLYPLDTLKMPEIKMDDYDDMLYPAGKKFKFKPGSRYQNLEADGKHKDAVRAYLACVSHVDACLKQVFDALEKSKYKDNTIVVLWGDHGWHLGEKVRYGKTGSWIESTRVPLTISVPGVTKGGTHTKGLVSLLDLYPTLADLCGLPKNPANEGKSFKSLIYNPQEKWLDPVLTTMGYRNHAVIGEKYYYVNNFGKMGVEELYDMEKDPMQWKNLANNPEYKTVVAEMKGHLPKKDHMPEGLDEMKIKNEIMKIKTQTKKYDEMNK